MLFFNCRQRLTSAIENGDVENEKNMLLNVFKMEPDEKPLSNCPLFSNVSLGKKGADEETTADLIADIYAALQKK